MVWFFAPLHSSVQGYTPTSDGPSEYQTIPLEKIEDFGVHCKRSVCVERVGGGGLCVCLWAMHGLVCFQCTIVHVCVHVYVLEVKSIRCCCHSVLL